MRQRRPIIYIERMHTMAFAFVFFEAWTFTLSVVGLLGESRPHLVAVLIAHALAGSYGASTFRPRWTSWILEAEARRETLTCAADSAVFQVIQTQQFHKVFHDVHL